MSEFQFSEYFTKEHIVKGNIDQNYLSDFLLEFYLGLEFDNFAIALVGMRKDGQIVILDGEIFNNIYYKKFIDLVDKRLQKFSPYGIRSYDKTHPLIPTISIYSNIKKNDLPIIRKIEQEFKIKINSAHVNFTESIEWLIQALYTKLPNPTNQTMYKLVVHENAKPIIEGFMKNRFKISDTNIIENDQYSYLFKAMLYALYPLLKGKGKLPRFITPTI